ncbi:MAG: protein rep [Marinobacter sp.]
MVEVASNAAQAALSEDGRKAARSGVAVSGVCEQAQRASLGNTQTKSTPPVELGKRKLTKRQKAALRIQHREQRAGILRKISTLTRVRRCGCHPAPGAGAVGIKFSPASPNTGASAGFSGLERCGSVWACPACAARIAAHRASQLADGCKGWIESGGTIAMVTLTMRHHSGMHLKELWAAKSRAWRAVHNGRGYKEDKERAGIAGWATGTEVTHGKNGWHVHIHCLIFCRQRNSKDALESIGARAFERWSNSLESAGLPRPTTKHGVDVVAVNSGDGAREIGSYVVKGLAAESSLGQLKSGRGGNSTPFELLDSAGDGDTKSIALWKEWESASRGKRQMAWSRGMKQALQVDELTEQEIVDTDIDGETIGMISPDDWRKVGRNIEFRQKLLAAVLHSRNSSAAKANASKVARQYNIKILSAPGPIFDAMK